MFRRNMLPPSSGSKSKPNTKPAEAGGKLRLLFVPEDGSNMFLQNIRLSLNCMSLKPRRPYF
jgi:hypothetical protein